MLFTWKHILEAGNPEILSWAEQQPWAKAMARCQQDPQWHAEGDVWTHTKLVCHQLEQLEEWNQLDRSSQLKLLLTALFHDSGKPETTRADLETGRLRSPKHSMVGENIARAALRSLGCTLKTREEIAALVRWHGRPPYLLEKAKPEMEVISLSWQVNNRLLYLFALADTRGRTAADYARSEENLHLWKMLCQERNCFEMPYAFANDQARFLFYRNQLGSFFYTPHEDFKCTVSMLSGMPGSGKDTWLKAFRPNLPAVSLDSVRAELDIDATENQGEVIQTAREQCREHLRARRDFAFNATNITRLTRKRWIDLFSDYGARVEIVYIEPPIEVLFKQNKNRPHPVPFSAMTRLLEKLEPPNITEAHALQTIENEYT